MIIISDTSPITSLAAINRLFLLENLYTNIIIPEAVAQEIVGVEPLFLITMTIITQRMNFPQWLRAISIHAPHAYAICIGLKKEEYRTRSTNYRGWALIHSSGSKASDACFQDYFIDPAAIGVKRYALVGAAEIYDCIGTPRDYRYLLRNAIAFSNPIEGVKGQQSIFWGASDMVRMKAFAEAWAMLQARLR